ncbi:hypothetical protein [Tenacibaculum jejuense]|uniref:Thioredoxin family protein n=1 Tax=Tenacibaculum jejuense TaxID=584609 RepID=A0A238U909_9FLAO|nr:hypothetical protein [Tenacibaculum jejuense]SNR15657.1 conserved protein of unknown function [Tenacibaculum jejuense]
MHKNLLLFVTFFIFIFSSKSQIISSELIDNALMKAKEENKYVFVNYRVESCELSKKLEHQMTNETCKPLYNTSYVVVDIVLPENKAKTYFGSIDNRVKTNTKVKGFPFWYILDNDGNFIEMSYDANGNNIGYPTTKKKVNEFIKIVSKTSKLTERKLNIIANSLHIQNNEQLLSGK